MLLKQERQHSSALEDLSKARQESVILRGQGLQFPRVQPDATTCLTAIYALVSVGNLCQFRATLRAAHPVKQLLFFPLQRRGVGHIIENPFSPPFQFQLGEVCVFVRTGLD
jgi:hypothetical protein